LKLSCSQLVEQVVDKINFLGATFWVDILSNAVVEDLQIQIFNKNKDILEPRGVLALRLTLWKLSLQVPAGHHSRSLIRKIKEINFPDPESIASRASPSPQDNLKPFVKLI
jgi:hypothetical protein